VGSIISQDTGVLFGSDLKPGDFKDNNVGKVLDNIHACGASKPFSQIAWQACQRYDLDQRFLHYDTTSVGVHGDYAAYAERAENRIAVTHGHSKDKRPDVKQFMMEALCVKGSVPLLGAFLSGNTSDIKANNAELDARFQSYPLLVDVNLASANRDDAKISISVVIVVMLFILFSFFSTSVSCGTK